MRSGQTGGCCRSTGSGIVALRRSWRDIFLWKAGDKHKERKKEQKRKKRRPVETDAADGNPLTTRIPTGAWKAQNAFHSSHKARRRFHHRIHFFREPAVHFKHGFFWSEGRGATQTTKQQVCQFQIVSIEGFTPSDCARTVPKLYQFSALGIALSENQIPRFIENVEKLKQKKDLLESEVRAQGSLLLSVSGSEIESLLPLLQASSRDAHPS